MNETINLNEFMTDIGVSWKGTNPDDDLIRNTFYDEDFKDSSIYKYVDQIERRGDGSGHETYFFFKRIEDGKHFFYYIYDGRIEESKLEEVTKKVTVVWDIGDGNY